MLNESLTTLNHLNDSFSTFNHLNDSFSPFNGPNESLAFGGVPLGVRGRRW